MEKYPRCVECIPKYCRYDNYNKKDLPNFCPMRNYEEKILKIKEKYSKKDIKKLYIMSEKIHKMGYYKVNGVPFTFKSRVELLIEFIKSMSINGIRIAFCVALSQEAFKLTKILKKK